MGEGGQGLQERCVLVAQELGREGCQLAPASFGCAADQADDGAGRLHRCQGRGPVQAGDLPLLSRSCLIFFVVGPTASLVNASLMWPAIFVCSLSRRCVKQPAEVGSMRFAWQRTLAEKLSRRGYSFRPLD